MKRYLQTLFLSLLIFTTAFSKDAIPKPEDFFGFVPGSDQNLFTYEQLIEYLQKLDSFSDRRVIGPIPEEDIVISGYCEKQQQLADKALMMWLRKGKGQMVLMGFCPEFRAYTHATYKLLFNALLLDKRQGIEY